MNDILKQRLIGALVLIALGVVFWPVMFVEPDRTAMDQTSQVAPMPQLEEVDIPAPQPLADVEPVVEPLEVEPEATQPAPAASDDDVPEAASESSDSGAAPASPNLDERGIPVAWVLQVASVSTREKADGLTARLIEEGHKAYNRSIRRDGKVLYRVFVGPVFEREKLIVVKRDLDTQLDVNGIIARYVP